MSAAVADVARSGGRSASRTLLTISARLEDHALAEAGRRLLKRRWVHGFASATGVSALAVAAASTPPVMGAQPLPAIPVAFEEARAQMITPLGFGADSGRRSGATDAVRLLSENPEPPTEELTGLVGHGLSFASVLERAGVGSGDRQQALKLVKGFLDPGEIENGTRLDIILGSRGDRRQARPLDTLSFRARLDLALTIKRTENGLVAEPQHIAVDSTPMRITGKVGEGIFNAARDAGVPSQVVREYLKLLGSAGLVNKAASDDEFDIVFEHQAAETGEVRTGKLLYAGFVRDGKAKMQELRWKDDWYEADGIGENKGEMLRPVSGAITSNYGLRRHPVLGYRRMHAGIDFRASYGTPIRAAQAGKVVYAGRHGGHGNFVKLSHGGGIGTGYAHMSRIAVRSGSYVKQGDIIGYVGSTGLSTGPHLHYELYRGGRTVNPNSVRFLERAKLAGQDLKDFKSRMSELTAIKPGPKDQPEHHTDMAEKPVREIDLLAREIG